MTPIAADWPRRSLRNRLPLTGLRATMLPPNARLSSMGRISSARGLQRSTERLAFWYENSNGLAEIAVNQGRSDRDLGLAVGIPVEIVR